MIVCDESNDAYNDVCSNTPRLCPRLVPTALWGLSLATLSRISPQIAVALFGELGLVVEDVGDFWKSARETLRKSATCSGCLTQTVELDLDEDWLYCTYYESELSRVSGVAYLRGLRPLCRECHIAKHQGYAKVTGKSTQAVQHLARVNNLSFTEAENLVAKAFRIHTQLSSLSDWKIVVGDIGMSEPLRKGVEELLNIMYTSGYSVLGIWLEYRGHHGSILERRCLRETLEVLTDVGRKHGQVTVDSAWLSSSLVEELESKLSSKGVEVHGNELHHFFNYEVDIKFWKTLVRVFERFGEQEKMQNMLTNIMSRFLSGFWLVYVSRQSYPAVVRDVIDSLNKAGLAYAVKCLWHGEDLDQRKQLPLRIEVPSLLATTYVSETAYTIKASLEKHGVKKTVYFVPSRFEGSEKCRSLSSQGYKCYVFTITP